MPNLTINVNNNDFHIGDFSYSIDIFFLIPVKTRQLFFLPRNKWQS